jgi:endonuclease G, mitochondrial
MVAGEPPPLGAYRTFQVPIADIAMLTDLRLDHLVAVDRMPVAPGPAEAPEPGRVSVRWVELQALDDVHLLRARSAQWPTSGPS